ncbi:hypothetical protein [Bradyrhizobium guangdongense]|uniref:Uncharacterized protein n=1 Tax=Bradyrhizobium guangdongense TaxID=1325090 RepID=A0A410V645_9BRAD|nr:hypothetical protein [Bradyrhizobium guangdongense]QAU39155.1 hypothetical protein X265_16890 [Bradyrhizobium guangdongense]QOZ60212.1 hypothetical protein XH86_16895 [Bradyrhizobium guangdongense]GGI26900.1 hypothetical protein GCM10010987_41700 [Bradyrhizobium guangdongense]
MAKKAKKASKAAKKSSSTTKMLRVPLHSVVHFVRMLQDEKHAANFVKAARDSNAVVALHPATVDFVRNFVADKQLHHAMVTKVVDPCPGDPFECHFRD